VRVAPWNRAQHAPSLVVLPGDTLVVAWQEVLAEGQSEIRVATSQDRGDTWAHRVRVDARDSVDAWVPSLAADPVTGALHLAFVDARGDDPNRRVYLTSSGDAGATWSAVLRVDPRERDRDNPDMTLTNEWTPRVVAHAGHVVVAYTHRERPSEAEQPSWDATIAESHDGGASFGAPRRLDGGGSPERIAADPALAIDATGAHQLAFSTYRGAKPDSDIVISTSSTELAFLPDAAAKDQWWPAIAALGPGRFAVAWQDFTSGGNDIYVAMPATSGTRVIRVDDAGASDAQAWRPRMTAAPDGTLYVFWEDSRSGHAELRVTRGVAP
jgi:hypothetical protein